MNKNGRKTVLFVYPAIDYQNNYATTWLPYSVLYLADALRDQGRVDVLVYDANIPQPIPFEKIVADHGENLLAVGFSIMTGGSQIKSALDMAKCVKEQAPHALRLFGGPHVNVLPGQTCVHPLVDVATVGPGQFILPKVVEALTEGRTLQGLPGVWTKTAEGTVVEPACFQRDWAADGLHHWDRIDATPYVRADDLLGPRTLNYISSFGCAFQCRFCYEQHYKRKYHDIGAETVLADVQGLIRKYDLTGVKFYDADFFIKRARAENIWTRLAQETPVEWAASIHPRDVLNFVKGDKDALVRMAASGCRRLLMGVESGDPRVLKDVVKKLVTPEEIYEAARLVDAAGIRGAYTFILGFPGERPEEKARTKEFAMRLAELPTSPEVRFHGYMPYPGTPMFEDAVKGGFVTPTCLDGWSTFDYYPDEGHIHQTPWLTAADIAFIQDWSQVTGRRLVEKEAA